MRDHARFPILLLGVAVALCACHKKAPVTAAQIAPEAPPPAPVATATPHPEPRPVPAPDPWSGDLDSINAYIQQHGLLGDVYFEFDRAELGSDARQQLSKNGRFLAEHPDFVVSIEGHCDERGTSEYNLALGHGRAHAAKEYLGQLGIDAGRLQTISYGKERPICTVSGEQCWWRNRRARFVVVGRTAPTRPS